MHHLVIPVLTKVLNVRLVREACADVHVQKLRYLVLEKGRPYDTMEEVIGLRGTPGHGSLREWDVAYNELSLAADGGIDWDNLPRALSPGEIGTQERLPTMYLQYTKDAALSWCPKPPMICLVQLVA